MQFTLNMPSTYIIEYSLSAKSYAIFNLQSIIEQGQKKIIKKIIKVFKSGWKSTSYTKARKYIQKKFGELEANQFSRTRSFEWVAYDR